MNETKLLKWRCPDDVLRKPGNRMYAVCHKSPDRFIRPLPRLNENLADKASWPTQHLHQVSTRSSRRTTTVCILLSRPRLLIASRLTALRERLEHTKATANRIEFSSLVQDVAKLRKVLIDAIPLLPLYDQRQAELVGGFPHSYHLQSRELIYGPSYRLSGV